MTRPLLFLFRRSGCSYIWYLLAVMLAVPFLLVAQENYDEAKAGNYVLPDPLTFVDGRKVTTAEQWRTERRPEILKLFEDQVFGRVPANAPFTKVTSLEEAKGVLGGLADRKQLTIQFLHNGFAGPTMRLLLYLPSKRSGPVPVFLGLNFSGNQGVSKDPGIVPGVVWARDKYPLVVPKPGERAMASSKIASDDSRGQTAGRWQVEKILQAGFGLATIYYGDIEPDTVRGLPYSIRGMALKPGETAPAADE
ncbi:MAG: hypothetical protein LC114_19010 [Bryobacterales bacterium]|nr:hypothetical protein [Bryobacterales bacterium]